MHKHVFDFSPLLNLGLLLLAAVFMRLFMNWLTRQRVIDDVHAMGGSALSVKRLKLSKEERGSGRGTFYEVMYRNRYERIGMRHCVAGWFTSVKWIRLDINSSIEEIGEELETA